MAIAGGRLLIPRSAAIAGRSAAWLRGGDVLAAGKDPVDILVPRRDRFGPIAGLRIHTTGRLDSDDVELDDRLLLTRPGRTAVDIALWAPDIVEAVVALDVMLACGVVRQAQLDRAFEALPVGRAHRRARRAVTLAHDRRRLNRLVNAGWRVIHVTAGDLHDGSVVTLVRTALAA